MTHVDGLDLLLGFAGVVATLLIGFALVTVFGGALTAVGWWVRNKVERVLEGK